MNHIEQVTAAKMFLRRTRTQAQLEELAEQVWAEASESVTITSTASEGASVSGTLTFPKHVLLLAVEELLAELNGDMSPRRVAHRVRWSGSEVEL